MEKGFPLLDHTSLHLFPIISTFFSIGTLAVIPTVLVVVHVLFNALRWTNGNYLEDGDSSFHHPISVLGTGARVVGV